MNIIETIVLHFPSDTNRVYFVKLNSYSIIIDRVISALGYGKEVLDGLNAVDKRFIYIYINLCPMLNFLDQT